MMTMTTESTGSEDPLSTGARAPHLHLVTESGIAASNGESKDKSLFGFIRSMIKGKAENEIHDALKEFADDYESGVTEIAADERAMIENILALRGMRAVDVMIPRADIIAIDSSISKQELFALLSEKQYSRFPVYRETLDDVIGTIHIKDILARMARNEPIEIESMVRDVPIVSPAMQVLDLVLEMKQTRRHMALVVDEYGGIDGLVTVGDILGAIVGEIEDEHEVNDQPQISLGPDGAIIADGRVSVEEFESRFGDFLQEDERQDIDTLGGLVFSLAGRVPARGEVLSHDSGMVFEVLDADPRRVSRLRIRNIPKEQPTE